MTHACSEEACTQPGTQLAGTRSGADLLFCAYYVSVALFWATVLRRWGATSMGFQRHLNM